MVFFASGMQSAATGIDRKRGVAARVPVQYAVASFSLSGASAQTWRWRDNTD